MSMGHGVCIATRKTCQGCVSKGFACLAQEVGCRDHLECVRARVIRFAFQKEGWCQCWEVDGREGQTLVPVRGGHHACPSNRAGFGVGQGFGRGGFRHERWITESIGAAVGMRRGRREEKQMVLRFLSQGPTWMMRPLISSSVGLREGRSPLCSPLCPQCLVLSKCV